MGFGAYGFRGVGVLALLVRGMQGKPNESMRFEGVWGALEG